MAADVLAPSQLGRAYGPQVSGGTRWLRAGCWKRFRQRGAFGSGGEAQVWAEVDTLYAYDLRTNGEASGHGYLESAIREQREAG